MKKFSLTIFTNNFITALLGIFPHEIGEKRAFFTLGLGPIFGPKNAVGKSRLYYFNQILIVILFVLFLLLIVIILLFLVHLVQAIKWAIFISYCCRIFSIFIVHEHFLYRSLCSNVDQLCSFGFLSDLILMWWYWCWSNIQYGHHS